jgi:plasmid stabilization system protein ParE
VTLTTSEHRQLDSFRRAAEQIRAASIIAEGQQITLHVHPGNPGFVDVFVKLLGNEPFRSLALALRLVYQQREPANFRSICNILYRAAELPALKECVASLRSQYDAALEDPEGRVSAGEPPNMLTFSTQEVLEHWLYGIAFHQDEDRQVSVSLLSSEGARFHASVQATGLKLAGRILDLDDVIADFLGEPRLPRI